jgi:hypothetical protein
MSPELTPVEVMVLYRPDGTEGRRAVEVALTLLFARNVLEVERPESARRSWRPARVRVAADPDESALPEYLAAVARALRNQRKPDASMLPAEMWSRLQQAFGLGFGGYVREHIWPALIARGLASERETRVLGVFARRVRELTASGQSLQAQVQLELSPARELPRLMKKSPDYAADLILRLGPLALLLPETRPYARTLSELARARRVATLPEPVADEHQWRGFDTLVDADWILMFDAMDATTDASGGGGDAEAGE